MNHKPPPCSPAHWPRLLLVLGLACGGGAGCPQMVRQAQVPLPRVIPVTATREQVMAAVNGNAARVQSYYTTSATIGSPMFPSVRASIALERPRNFRLRADTAFTGPEVDLGSNPAEFWFWIRRNQPPALYFCRHDRFDSSPARQMFPIEPDWLIEALGVTGFAPEEEHVGPFAAGTGRLEMRTVRRTANGPVHKITILDDSSGLVLEQHLYDAQGRLFAKALASDHRRDVAQQVTLPHHVEIHIPAMQMELKIDVRDIELNSLGENSRNLWVRPTYDGWTDIDLGDPNLHLPEPAQRNYRPAAAPTQPTASQSPRTGFFKRLFRR